MSTQRGVKRRREQRENEGRTKERCNRSRGKEGVGEESWIDGKSFNSDRFNGILCYFATIFIAKTSEF